MTNQYLDFSTQMVFCNVLDLKEDIDSFLNGELEQLMSISGSPAYRTWKTFGLRWLRNIIKKWYLEDSKMFEELIIQTAYEIRKLEIAEFYNLNCTNDVIYNYPLHKQSRIKQFERT